MLPTVPTLTYFKALLTSVTHSPWAYSLKLHCQVNPGLSQSTGQHGSHVPREAGNSIETKVTEIRMRMHR